VFPAGAYWGGPQWPAVRGGDDLDVAAVVFAFARPPQVHSGCGSRGPAPVGFDHGPVDVDMGVAGHLRCQQYRFQARGLGGEDVDAFVEVVVGGGLADAVVACQLGQSGAVEEPADDQDRLFEAAQRPGSRAGTAALAFGA
jgi:hypothetical protein